MPEFKEKVLNFLKRFKGFSVFAGFSGGADSTALLLLINSAAPDLKIKLHAVHFQHNLRGKESSGDAEWCKAFCKERKIKFIEINLDVKKDSLHGEGVEAAARRLRMNAWEKLLSGKSKAVAALGHHADDRIENLFIRAFRGSNSSGLTSMRSVHSIGNVTYIRPMLSLRKNEIEIFLNAENIRDWRTDSSNNDTVYRRNFLRKKILPEIYENMDFAEGGLQQSISVLEDDAEFIEKEAAVKFSKIKGTEKTLTKFWTKLHPALKIRVLRSWLSERLERDFIPDKNLMERFSEELSNERLAAGEKILIPLERNLYLKLQKDKVSILKYDSSEISRNAAAKIWNWKKTPHTSWQKKEFSAKLISVTEYGNISVNGTGIAAFDADKLPENLMIRLSETGDRMQPFGSKENVRLKKLFSGKKISADDKKTYPIITTPDNKIIWIPGVRHSAFASVTEKTKYVLSIISKSE